MWHCHHLSLKDCGNAGIQIHKHLKNWLNVIFKLFWTYPSVCKSSLQHLPEESAGDFGKEAPESDPGVPEPSIWWSSGAALTPNTQQGPECISQPRASPETSGSKTPWGAARGEEQEWVGKISCAHEPMEGEMDPAQGPSQWESFMGTTRNKGTS